MRSVQIRHSGLLMITAMIWGAAFVAQSVGMNYVGPATFLFARSVLGSAVLIPLVYISGRIQDKKDRKQGPAEEIAAKHSLQRSFRNPVLIRGGAVCGFFLFAASYAQQAGIQFTTAGKAGFITTFYIMAVPVIGIFLGKKTRLAVWIAVFMGIVGLYFLCITETFSIGTGDLLMVLCALLFAGQILAVDHYVPFVDAIRLSFLQFVVESLLAGLIMLMTETPHISDLAAAAAPILYAGLLSTGVGYTLQIVGQKDMNPAVASLIMSLEAVFSVIFGFLILHERMTGRETAGCIIMFAATLVAQLPTSKDTKTEAV